MSTQYSTWDYRDPEAWLRSVAKKDLPPLIITAAITGGVHGKEINPSALAMHSWWRGLSAWQKNWAEA